jgi:hypothetical protein
LTSRKVSAPAWNAAKTGAVEAVELLGDVGELHQPGFADIDTAWFEVPRVNGAVSARKP